MTADELLDLLDEDLGWRKKEIGVLYSIAQNNDKPVLIKSLLLIVYSHWEGFIKNSFKLYLDHVNKQNIKLTDLTDNYRAIILRKISNKCINSSKKLTLENEMEFIRSHSESINSTFSIEQSALSDKDSSLIDTSSNLKPEVFFNLCNVIGFPEKESVKIRRKWIDENLLENRHAISHGNKVLKKDAVEFDLTLESLAEIKEIILAIMSSYKEDISEYSSKKLYLLENNCLKNEYDIESNDRLRSFIKFH
jgi:hypothetical protein